MKRQPWLSFEIAGVSLTHFGLKIPSPVVSLQISNGEIASMTSWVLTCTLGGSDTRNVNVASFEALLYSAAQAASGYENSSGIPVSFCFGWLNDDGEIAEYLSYQGFTLQFQVSTTGQFMTYTIRGFASLAVQSHMPVLNIPELSGIVQPSAVVEALAKAVKATSYYTLDIDHNDNPTYVSHGAMTTSFTNYVRGSYSEEDDYDSFPGLLRLSKSYNGSRDSAGLVSKYRKLSQVMNNTTVSPLSNFLKKSITDTTPQGASFSYWIDEPTMTQPGVIHYKSNAGLVTSHSSDTLVYGTSDGNVISISGQYNGIAYNMTDMRFSTVGFSLDASGNSVVQGSKVVNSWSSSLADVFQTVDIINDVNAIASQFSGDFTVQIPGSTRRYDIAQPVSLLVMSENTVSPISGVYNIIHVSHAISDTFVTTLKLQRLVMSTANQVASSQNIVLNGTGYFNNTISKTSNIKTPYSVDFGELYPTFEHIGLNM